MAARAVPPLVLVTDRRAARDGALVPAVRAALDAGLPAVQLREKDLSGRALFALAEELRALTAAAGALLVVNDRADIACAVGADGVHLPGGGLPVDVARRVLPAGALVGVSTHAPGEAAGADYAFFGPVWDTPSKAAIGPPQGPEALRRAVAAAGGVPVLAIGGVTPARVDEARAAGAAGVAVIAAILGAADPGAATRALLAALAR
jgi:thiamine-phosphate pyrophosphorylase